MRRRYADDEAAKRREASKKEREERRQIDPFRIIQRDRRLLKSVIDKWNDKKETASLQISKMEALLEMADKAFEFIKTLTAEKLTELREPLAWRNYEELSYVFAMNELF